MVLHPAVTVAPLFPPDRDCYEPRPLKPATNAEALIRDVVQKLQGQGNAEAERLRAAMRKAIGMLQAAVES